MESGVHGGVGTWFLQQMAGPEVTLVVISPELLTTYVDDGKAVYLTDSQFVDFSETAAAQWNRWLPDGLASVLLFFDDNQAQVRRLAEARRLGFVHIMLDDNYPAGNGDNLSLRMVCNGLRPWQIVGASPVFRDDFNRIQRPLSAAEVENYQNGFYRDVAVYAEFPPACLKPVLACFWL